MAFTEIRAAGHHWRLKSTPGDCETEAVRHSIRAVVATLCRSPRFLSTFSLSRAVVRAPRRHGLVATMLPSLAPAKTALAIHLFDGRAANRPPTGSLPYLRAAQSFWASSRSVQGGRQREFHSVNTSIASSSGRENPRTRRQQTRKVSLSPWSPAHGWRDCCQVLAGTLLRLDRRWRAAARDATPLDGCLTSRARQAPVRRNCTAS